MSTSSPLASPENPSQSKKPQSGPARETSRLDPAEFSLRRRLPPSLPRRDCDVYITNRTAFPAQLERCRRLLDSGEPFLFLHSLGAAIPRAINLALQIEQMYKERVRVDTQTETVELTDDFEPLRGDANFESRSRHNSAVHIKISLTSPTTQPWWPVLQDTILQQVDDIPRDILASFLQSPSQ